LYLYFYNFDSEKNGEDVIPQIIGYTQNEI